MEDVKCLDYGAAAYSLLDQDVRSLTLGGSAADLDVPARQVATGTLTTGMVRKRKKNQTPGSETTTCEAALATDSSPDTTTTDVAASSEKSSPVMQKVVKQDASLEQRSEAAATATAVVLVESGFCLLVPDSSVMDGSGAELKQHARLASSCSFCGHTSSSRMLLERAADDDSAAFEPPVAHLRSSFMRNISSRLRSRRRTTSLSELAAKTTAAAKMASHAESVPSGEAEISGGVSAAVASASAAVDVDQAVPSPSSPPPPPPPPNCSAHFESFNQVSFFKQCNMVSDWFKSLNEERKNSLLAMLLENCGQQQNHLLSLRIAEPHFDCEPNCCDMISLLPKVVSRQILSYLDPVSLARASQVNTYWYDLASDSLLWKRFCHLPKWRFSAPSEAKQLNKFTDGDGFVDWKGVFGERFRVKRNWLAGKSVVKTFEGHEGAVSCVQFDDKRIVAGSSIGTIKVWNIAEASDPRPYLNLYGHSGIIRCLYLDGSLNRLYSGSADHSIKVWDLSDHPTWSRVTCKMTLLGHTDTVRCLQVNEAILISGSYDSTLKIWSLETGVCQNTLRGHTDSVLCLQFDHEKIVSGSADKTIRIWNFEGSCLQQLEGHSGAITCLHFDSQRIISGSLDFDIKFWRIDNGLCINTLNWITKEGHTAAIRCLKADSQKIVSCSDDKTIKIWNIETGERYVTLKNHSDGVTCLQFNDYYILSGSYDRTIKLWDFSAL